MTENMLTNNKKSMKMPKGATIIGKSKRTDIANAKMKRTKTK
jgi:hypothetical protein